METSIVETELTDQSKVYDVVFVDGSQKAVINCTDFLAAVRLNDLLLEVANGASIEPA